MTNTDVVKKLIGKTQPYGDSNIDRERFENLKAMCELVGDLIEEIKDAAREKDRYESSMKEMGRHVKITIMIEKRHLIYTYKGKVYQAYKNWTFKHCEEVLTRLGATYWEIG